jgi:hypothetical protein
VVEGTGLENRQVKSLVGSNPTLSAKVKASRNVGLLLWRGIDIFP